MRYKRVKIILCVFFLIIMAGCDFYSKSENNHQPTQQAKSNKEVNYQYYYQKLNNEEQKAYHKLYTGFIKFQKEIVIEHINLSKAKKIYQYILMDYPSLFYIQTSFQYIQEDNKIKIKPSYLYNKDEVQKYNKQIEKETESVIQQVNQQMDDFNKIKMIYQYIIETVHYQNNKNDQNMLSALIDNESVCAGYAKAYQYLLLKCGIKATYMSGVSKRNTSNDNFHAWIMLCIDDDYYYSDVTWGDVEDKNMTHCCYSCFLMNSEDMLRCYQPDNGYEKTMKNEYNYYKSIDCYMEDYDRDLLSHAIQNALKNETRIVEVKCATESVYQKLKDNLQNSHLGYFLLKENHCYDGKLICSWRDSLRVVEFCF